ncbi:RNA polymerase sigma-70 factor, ECF subfamily [Rhizobiales bacterium GAS191]|jgi:RNA polymerase sigma-70 factor (ECF subfamily)|nr:RNA polymerase sigma-70 factor, ECF subfamily [Rhizobiales bacterium GAS113]SEC10525.1 RNA polymerase sigma-70 factor, ECF subfamily [Rhizobiales bacterium GAS191]SED09685.1 RNA polymerase sigma-70 factor, ECF subfamily [Rhizobiales bacterium GAS188]
MPHLSFVEMSPLRSRRMGELFPCISPVLSAEAASSAAPENALACVRIRDNVQDGSCVAPPLETERGMRASEDIVELMGRVARQDRAAFAELYRATSAKLFGTAFRILRRRDLAEEVLQEVYAKIWERAGDFDAAKASPVTWMAAIVRNRALDEVRRKPMTLVEDMPEGFEPAADNPDPLAARERSEKLRQLLACLDKLDPQKRQMVLLAYYHGASREALAARYEAPVPTIKTWLHRSLAQLRLCLSS